MTEQRRRPSRSHLIFPLTAITWIVSLRQPRYFYCDALSSVTTKKKSILPSIPRVSASEFDRNVHYFHENYETPVIVEGVLSQEDCETWTQRLIEECGSSMIDLQRKRREKQTDMYQCSFEQALDLVMESKHGDSLLAFCEGFLTESSQELSILEQKREALFQKTAANKSEDPCWFEHFPLNAKPSDCVILAGEGATSTLHRDPFEWTGTSICLEGTKIWRFAPPPGALLEQDDDDDDDDGCSGVGVIDRALDAYRLDSIAWGDDDDDDDDRGLTISAGWQSDLSFFADRDKQVPRARALSDIELKQGEGEKIQIIESTAINTNMLRPNNVDIPALWAGVQRPGDLIVIPAYWWHQTYAMEPSLAVASQRCGAERDAERVVRHILETATREAEGQVPAVNEIMNGKTPKDVVDQLFRYLAVHKS
jgi:hypothetical protein